MSAGRVDGIAAGRSIRRRCGVRAGGTLLSGCLAAVPLLPAPCRAQTTDRDVGGACPAQTVSANGNPPAAQKAAQDAIPLTPAMIEELARRYNATQQAEEQAVTQLAAPINRQINVSFAPGWRPASSTRSRAIRRRSASSTAPASPGRSSGTPTRNPAAISGGTNCNAQTNAGGPSAVAIGFFVCTPTKGSNVLEITPISLAPRGGLVVSLEGAPKPLTFLLVSGGGRYDADLSVHVADRGPHAKVEIMTQPDAPDTGAPFLTGMLEGVPPADATPLAVEGVSPEGLRAWRLGRNVYLRTRYTLLSPEWTASEAEAGTHSLCRARTRRWCCFPSTAGRYRPPLKDNP